MGQKIWMGIICLVLLSITSCSTDEELNDAVDGFYTLNADFVSPSNIRSNYAILFNNDTIKNTYYVGRANPSGILTVFEKGNKEPVYTEELKLTSNMNVQFIKLGDKIDTYSDDKYTKFSLDIKWATNEDRDKYKATFNGSELNTEQGNINYVLTEALTGSLQLKKIDDGNLVLDREITVEPNGTFTFLQLSSTEFLAMPPGDEEDPESNNYKKIRVYYTITDDDLREESYTIKFYTFDSWLYDKEQVVDIGYEFEIKAGELSPYILVYGRTFENENGDGGPAFLTYDLIAKDGTVVREHDPNQTGITFNDTDWGGGDFYKYLNKFETYNINFVGTGTLVLEEKWE
ncbi:hypothetical protein [Dysgonomonas termitidis]|uniref:Uncharacterized protein n=1 Tax=Dysgonomonas termitidis TaxID=1516126 RepID=A0ABV9KV84_9BACT